MVCRLKCGFLLVLVVLKIVCLVNRLPSRDENSFSSCNKALTGGSSLQCGLLIFKCRIEDADETAHHQVVDFAFFVAEMLKKGRLLGWNNGVMVADLLIIYE